MSEQYDLSCNGYEVLSGSIRNHSPELLLEAFLPLVEGCHFMSPVHVQSLEITMAAGQIN